MFVGHSKFLISGTWNPLLETVLLATLFGPLSAAGGIIDSWGHTAGSARSKVLFEKVTLCVHLGGTHGRPGSVRRRDCADHRMNGRANNGAATRVSGSQRSNNGTPGERPDQARLSMLPTARGAWISISDLHSATFVVGHDAPLMAAGRPSPLLLGRQNTRSLDRDRGGWSR
jgi:hypothetical protein